MAITAALVKELRERTGAGMMECKKALVETNGDIETAIDNMRKSGAAKAEKKAGRIAAEGIIITKSSDDGKLAAIVEVNSETDFVARDENFKAFADQVIDAALSNKTSDIDTLNATTLASGETVEAARTNLVAKIGENIGVRRVQIVEASEGVLASYIHGGRIGVVAALKAGDQDLAKDIAMHAAATNPQFVRPEDISEDVYNREKEIFTAQAKESGKPAEIIEKMIVGRMRKFAAEVSLVGQAFVKDPSMTVGELLKKANADVTSLVRFEVGEGIEKKEEDFAAEVMAQVKGE
ncbi:translation elongation factor Ts [Aliikangiella coralliicola]|uniref:Elongation factor Ts n=1 Tax=Aliikangiella coralliicola TaxID=2592383 RepID=A0A545UAZ2_9GAMM|nr:translation elongation factor Ts [Aliikangiella coralliicola]TQV86644.1 elongation factor Ts [Aliikangiella coralliicola]